MTKDDLKDELTYLEWLFYGKIHLRTALHVFIPTTIIWCVLFNVILYQ